MDEPLEARIDALAQELIQLAHEAGQTIFIGAAIHGQPEVDAVLVVSADPPRAKQLEAAFEEMAQGWQREDGAPPSPGLAAAHTAVAADGEGVLGLN